MLIIDVRVNERRVARALVHNVGGPDHASEYACRVRSEASTLTDAPAREHAFPVPGHDRMQGPWALVAKVAAEAASRERAADARHGEGADAPDPDFEAALSDRSAEPGMDLVPLLPLIGHPLQDTVLAGTPLSACDYGHLFAYMHRRFGPAPIQGDARKDLCGSWLLGTRHPHLFVHVIPSVHGAEFCFVALVEREGRLRPPEPDVAADLCEAYRGCLLDLLRPVPVRELHINALGRVPRGHALLRGDGRTAAPSPTGCLGTRPRRARPVPA